MSATKAQVSAAHNLLDCLAWGVAYYPHGLPVTCRTHRVQWEERGCPVALRIADAIADAAPALDDALPRHRPDEWLDPDCTCGLPTGHEGECR